MQDIVIILFIKAEFFAILLTKKEAIYIFYLIQELNCVILEVVTIKYKNMQIILNLHIYEITTRVLT